MIIDPVGQDELLIIVYQHNLGVDSHDEVEAQEVWQDSWYQQQRTHSQQQRSDQQDSQSDVWITD